MTNDKTNVFFVSDLMIRGRCKEGGVSTEEENGMKLRLKNSN